MNAKNFVALCLGVAIAVAGCKEKEVDSKFITVSSPKLNAVLEDKDSVIIEAVIKPEKTTVISYTVTVKTKNDQTIFSAQRGCDCESLSEVKLREAFLYDINKTSDVFLEIVAVLSDTRETRERVPFLIKD